MTRGRPRQSLHSKLVKFLRVEGRSYQNYDDLPKDRCWTWAGCWYPRHPTKTFSRRYGGSLPLPTTRYPQPSFQHEGKTKNPLHFVIPSGSKRMCPTKQCQNPAHYNVPVPNLIQLALSKLAEQYDLTDTTDEEIQVELPQFTVEEIHEARNAGSSSL